MWECVCAQVERGCVIPATLLLPIKKQLKYVNRQRMQSSGVIVNLQALLLGQFFPTTLKCTLHKMHKNTPQGYVQHSYHHHYHPYIFIIMIIIIIIIDIIVIGFVGS